MAWYPYSYKTAFNPISGEKAPAGSVGEVYAVGDTAFTTPLETFDLSGLPVPLEVQGDVGYVPAFQVEDNASVIWKSGAYVFEMVTSMPLPGPQGANVVGAVDNGDGTVTFSLSNGESVGPVALPDGPEGPRGPAGFNATGAVEDQQALADYVNETAGANPFSGALNATYASIDVLNTYVAGPDVVLEGDSMTAPSSGYGDYLSAITGATVFNAGVGGETSTTVAARMGADPFQLLPVAGAIPASGPVDVTIEYPAGAWPLLQGDGVPNGELSGVWAGVHGTLTLVKAGALYAHDPADRYVFTRTSDGNAVDVPAAVPFVSDFSIERRNDIAVIWVGRNNPSPAETVVSDVRKLVAHLNAIEKRYLVVGVCTGAGETTGTSLHTSITNLNSLLAADWGRLFVDARDYMVNDALAAAGISPTPQDVDDMEGDTVPDSLRVDAVHFNEAGKTAIANLIGKRLYDLIWVNEYNARAYPVPDAPLHDNGVVGTTHRYVASRSGVADATTLQRLYDEEGTVDLTTSGDMFKYLAEPDMQFMRQEAGTAGRIFGTADIGSTFTFSVVARTAHTGGQLPFIVDHYQAGRASDGSWQFSGDAHIYTPGSSAWALIMAVCDGAGSLLQVDATTVGPGAITGPGAGWADALSLGVSASAITAAIDVAELNIWPTALDATQREAHRTAMKAAYPALV